MGTKEVTLRELTPARNWGGHKLPDWVDERTRLYTGVTVRCAGQEWAEILAHFDGGATTAYITRCGFDVERHGPAIGRAGGGAAKYRDVVRTWLRETYGMEVTFDA